MPDYVYRCHVCREQREVTHSMFSGIPVVCECGNRMHKVPQVAAVNWNGPTPSAGGLHPLVRELNNTESQRRDEFAAKKEAHVYRTKG
jgi:putative FmdB family regulatory protein